MKKKILALILCLTMIIPFASVVISADAAEGYTLDEATKTFTVSTADGLIKVAELTCSTEKDYYTYNITLAADIDLTGKKWVPICYAADSTGKSVDNAPYGYTGTFDGAGHTIKGLSSFKIDGVQIRYMALIAIAWDGCVVKNVNFTDVALEGHEYLGTVIGKCLDKRADDADYTQKRGLTIQNVHVRNATITPNVTSKSNYAGGLVGRIETGNNLIENCTVYANINSKGNGVGAITGGETGKFDKAPTTFRNIVVAGDYYADGSDGRSAGVIGYNSSATINFENIISLANCTAKKDFGSIVGAFTKGKYSFTNCFGNGAFTYGLTLEKDTNTVTILNSSIIDLDGTMTATTANLFGNADIADSQTAVLTISGTPTPWNAAKLPVVKADSLKTTAAALFTDAAFLAKANEVIDTLAHVHVYDQEVASDIYVQTPATCSTPAVYFKSCACGDKGTETFNGTTPADHTYAEVWAKDENTHYHICIDCQTAKSDEGEHTLGDWTVTREATERRAGEKSRICSVCNYSITEEIPKLTPSDDSKDTEPAEKSGCGATVIGGVGFAMIIATGAAIALKKKED